MGCGVPLDATLALHNDGAPFSEQNAMAVNKSFVNECYRAIVNKSLLKSFNITSIKKNIKKLSNY